MAFRVMVVGACLTCLFASAPGARAAQDEALVLLYRQCLDQVRSGRIDQAKARLLGLDSSQLARVVARVRRGSFSGDDIRAAALLHAEIARHPDALPTARAAHAGAVATLSGLLDGSSGLEFLRDCHLLVIRSLQRQLAAGDLVRYLGLALGRFPGDPELILAQGSLWELLAIVPEADGASFDPNEAIREISRSRRDAHQVMLEVSPPGIYEKCAGLYSRALQVSPDSAATDEMRLRLSRVLSMAGRYGEAWRALAPFEGDGASRLSPELRYLAAMFRGRALLGLGKTADAADAYREAIKLNPGCQTAQVGLSSAIRAGGDGARARAVTMAMLTGPEGRGCASDPWLQYAEGQTWRLDELALRLHKGVRR